MKHIIKLSTTVFIVFLLAGSIFAQDLAEKNFRYFGKDILNDLRNFYCSYTLKTWTMALSGSVLIAYTPMDPFVANTYQEHIRGSRSDAVTNVFDPLGEWKKTWLVYLPLSVFDYIPWKKQPVVLRTIGNWGSRSSRALILGWPSVALFQRVLGAPRPSQGPAYWQPFVNATGVSGHVFVAGIPFLAAASMTDKLWLKGIFLAASTGSCVGRINDNKHYTSQVLLGWVAAWLSIRAISKTENGYSDKAARLVFTGDQLRVSVNF